MSRSQHNQEILIFVLEGLLSPRDGGMYVQKRMKIGLWAVFSQAEGHLTHGKADSFQFLPMERQIEHTPRPLSSTNVILYPCCRRAISHRCKPPEYYCTRLDTLESVRGDAWA